MDSNKEFGMNTEAIKLAWKKVLEPLAKLGWRIFRRKQDAKKLIALIALSASMTGCATIVGHLDEWAGYEPAVEESDKAIERE